MPIKSAVMIVIHPDTHLILSVSRKDNFIKFGLPGGGLEPGESFMECAIRETLEETGIVVKKCIPVFDDEENRCFYATEWSGEINTQEIAKVEWLPLSRLIEPNSAFPEFNTGAFQKLMSSNLGINIAL